MRTIILFILFGILCYGCMQACVYEEPTHAPPRKSVPKQKAKPDTERYKMLKHKVVLTNT